MIDRKDPMLWNNNSDEPIAPTWWFSQVLGRPFADYPDSCSIAEKEAIMKIQCTPEEMKRVSDAWMVRNPLHDFSWHCVGIANEQFRCEMSNRNPDDLYSPFPKSGVNFVTLVRDGKTGSDCGLTDAIKIALFYIKVSSVESMQKMVDKVQNAHKLRGVTFRGILGFEGYLGWKPGGNFGVAFRKVQKV